MLWLPGADSEVSRRAIREDNYKETEEKVSSKPEQ